MISGEFVLIHRKKDQGDVTENLISLVPNEGLYSMISRIRPTGDDEIVIKVVDYKLKPNKEAEKAINDMYASAEEERKIAILSGSRTGDDNDGLF